MFLDTKRKSNYYLLTFAFAAAFAASANGSAAETTRHVAARVPVQGLSRELAAERPSRIAITRAPNRAPHGTTQNPWVLQANLPGAVVHDIAFPTALVGYAAAELGQVWKTIDGGDHWTRIMNIGFPYYWYGVYALDADNVVISGFDNQAGSGIVRWSSDGGDSWSEDVVLTDNGWSMRVRFADATHGLVMDLVNFSGPNAAHYTIDGGATASDWFSLVVDANGGWFGNQFSLLPNQHARASGISYCDSADAGADWFCVPPIDAVFDGPVFFADDSAGWVGGGEIAPDVAGWLHRTSDGGATWSDRTLDSPWPIREIHFLTPDIGWAAGGNIYSAAGGIYFSDDGGKTWNLDLDSQGNEMDACAHVDTRIWCAGYDASFSGVVYVLDLVDDVIFANGFDP